MRHGTMKKRHTNLVLIGMPGSGKSTVGVLLAKKTSRDFIDTDVIIQTSQQRTLQDIVDRDGYRTLRKIEETVLLDLSLTNHVIATGGSAVYSDQAMKHLSDNGVVIFLDVTMATLQSRVHDFATRGIAKRPDQSLTDLFEERFALYTRYADITIATDSFTHEQVCGEIIRHATE